MEIITGDNNYGGFVFVDTRFDSEVPPVVRALHAELCRGPHTAPGRRYREEGSLYPACVRAWSVVQCYQTDRASDAKAAMEASEHV